MATMQSGMIYNVWPPLCNWAVFGELCVGSEFKQLEVSRYLINRPSVYMWVLVLTRGCVHH